MRHGPADLFSRAADRRTFGNALLLVPGPRFDQARGVGEDPRRDDRPLPAEARGRDHRPEESRITAGMSAPAVRENRWPSDREVLSRGALELLQVRGAHVRGEEAD